MATQHSLANAAHICAGMNATLPEIRTENQKEVRTLGIKNNIQHIYSGIVYSQETFTWWIGNKYAHTCKSWISPASDRTYLNILDMMNSPEKRWLIWPHAHLSSAMRSRAKEDMKASLFVSKKNIAGPQGARGDGLTVNRANFLNWCVLYAQLLRSWVVV